AGGPIRRSPPRATMRPGAPVRAELLACGLAAARAALELVLERRRHEVHHGDTGLDAVELDFPMQPLRDARRQLDQDLVFFGYHVHTPRRQVSPPARRELAYYGRRCNAEFWGGIDATFRPANAPRLMLSTRESAARGQVLLHPLQGPGQPHDMQLRMDAGIELMAADRLHQVLAHPLVHALPPRLEVVPGGEKDDRERLAPLELAHRGAALEP